MVNELQKNKILITQIGEKEYFYNETNLKKVLKEDIEDFKKLSKSIKRELTNSLGEKDEDIYYKIDNMLKLHLKLKI